VGFLVLLSHGFLRNIMYQQFDETAEHLAAGCSAVTKEYCSILHDGDCTQSHFIICQYVAVKVERGKWYEPISNQLKQIKIIKSLYSGANKSYQNHITKQTRHGEGTILLIDVSMQSDKIYRRIEVK
jgi:hypothetical protein